ncbi:MAG: hypothetical protein HKN71_06825 [Gemmatimonadetes bacterium]|nr:hypothetical protein [Gemmatimonadota bacterium]
MCKSPARRAGARTLVLLLLWTASPSAGSAQEPPDSTRADSVRVELRRLAALVDSLRAEVERLRAAGRDEEAGDALARLRAAAEAAAAEGGAGDPEAEEPREFVGRQRSLQALNPEISVNADIFAHLNKDDTGEDNFIPREFEISLISNLDPFSRAKIFVSRHVEGGELAPFESAHEHGHEEGGGFAVEEGYIEWVGLPGGVGLKVGRFFQQFGQLNRWHSHALPFQTRSLPHLAFIGEESLSQTGVSMHWLAPFGGASGTYEATVEVTRRESEVLFGDSDGMAALVHLNGFWTLSEATDLDLGVSWIRGRFEEEDVLADRTLWGVEGAFHWRPPGRSRYRGLMVRGGLMVLDGLVPHDDDGAGTEPTEEHDLAGHALGVWSLAELRLSRSWLVGARFDRTENPLDPDETAWLVSPTLSWWQSEFVRLRAEYDLMGRSFVTGREGRLLLQVTFAMGPHKHETY